MRVQYALTTIKAGNKTEKRPVGVFVWADSADDQAILSALFTQGARMLDYRNNEGKCCGLRLVRADMTRWPDQKVVEIEPDRIGKRRPVRR